METVAQGNAGRCWIVAGLNLYAGDRNIGHIMMHVEMHKKELSKRFFLIGFCSEGMPFFFAKNGKAPTTAKFYKSTYFICATRLLVLRRKSECAVVF